MVPFKLEALDHVVLLVRDLERTLAFYCDCLGAKEERRVDQVGLVQLRAGESLIDLVAFETPQGAWAKPQAEGGGRNMEHLCVAMSPFDEEAIRTHLATHRVPIADAGDRYGAKGTGPSIYIKDPDGNTVELKGPPNTAPGKPKQRTLTTQRLILRPIQLEDANALFAIFSDEISMQFWSEPAHKSIEQTRAFVARAVGPSDSGCVWAITTDGKRALGFISLYGRRERIIGLGYMLAPEMRGKGLVTEACEAALAFAFEDWDMQRVRAELDPRNTASSGVLERLGFTLEGVLREDFLYDGKYVDAANYGLLRAEWLARI
jgi:RimJ/RimL family protein N-acetyltransferase/catechol 2,3-dioxygenase-like lactoylglutathione lyase family enzyme